MIRTSLKLVAWSLFAVVALLDDTAWAKPSPSPDPAAPVAISDRRREIKALDIHERPNRPGHFYGNTVRRRTARSS